MVDEDELRKIFQLRNPSLYLTPREIRMGKRTTEIKSIVEAYKQGIIKVEKRSIIPERFGEKTDKLVNRYVKIHHHDYSPPIVYELCNRFKHLNPRVMGLNMGIEELRSLTPPYYWIIPDPWYLEYRADLGIVMVEEQKDEYKTIVPMEMGDMPLDKLWDALYSKECWEFWYAEGISDEDNLISYYVFRRGMKIENDSRGGQEDV